MGNPHDETADAPRSMIGIVDGSVSVAVGRRVAGRSLAASQPRHGGAVDAVGEASLRRAHDRHPIDHSDRTRPTPPASADGSAGHDRLPTKRSVSRIR